MKTKMKLSSTFALAAIAAIVAQSNGANAQDSFKASGYVDAGTGVNFSSFGNWTQSNMAAIRFSGEMGKGMGFIELPLSLSATGPGFSADTFEAYVGQKADSGFRWKLGKMDSPFGYDAKTSDGYFFSSRAPYMAQHGGSTYTGLDLGYGTGNLALDLIFGVGRGTYLSGAGVIPDLAINVGYKADALKFGVGFAYNLNATVNGHFLDVVLGYKMGALNLDAGFLMKLGQATGNSSMGFAIQPTYAMSDLIDLGARFDMVTGQASAIAFSTMNITAGPGFNFTKNLKLKVDWTMTSSTVAAVSTSSNALAINGVFKL